MDLTKSAERYMDRRLKSLQELQNRDHIVIDDIDKETTEEQKARCEAMLKDFKAWMSYYFPQYTK
ncbi:hypothetical protein [Dysgonomonas sp. ZJ279]|uniref:hypothetical protein n=1 Tax=Dysgonomonas sp. ZJ279 TaxID=2709796 RepID=UPI0013EBF185|nr:hypothetical protein [Dysgonomonas sp. ZJ279]